MVSEEYPEWRLCDLDTITDSLALHIRQAYGATKGQCVGIFMSKCPEYVISYIAALKAGK
jgi:acyl-CoA synthetase (AMP-forming)/AMP-acid ligase II